MKNRTIIGIVCMFLQLPILCCRTTCKPSDKQIQLRLFGSNRRSAEVQRLQRNRLKPSRLRQIPCPRACMLTPLMLSVSMLLLPFTPEIFSQRQSLRRTPTAQMMSLQRLTAVRLPVSVTIDTFAAGLSGKLQNGDIISLIVVDKNAGTSTIPGELKYMKVITTTTAGGIDQDSIVKNEDGSFEIPSTITVLCNTEQAKLLAK